MAAVPPLLGLEPHNPLLQPESCPPHKFRYAPIRLPLPPPLTVQAAGGPLITLPGIVPRSSRPHRDERVFGPNYHSTMPYGLKRFQRAEALHFIPFSCLHRLSLPEAPELKETVEAILEQPWARHEARVYAYVLMPEHVHLLTRGPLIAMKPR